MNTAALARAQALAGDEAAALATMQRLQGGSFHYVPPFDVATVEAALGCADDAFAHLAQACDEGSSWLRFAAIDPRLRPLRADPRFPPLLARLGLDRPLARG
jgi:hypothetical protein